MNCGKGIRWHYAKQKIKSMKVGLLICTYNRPEYLRQCLESVKALDIVTQTLVLIMDDGSDNSVALGLIRDFEIKDIPVTKVMKKHNRSIKHSILTGSEHLFDCGCDVVINLDGDAIVKPNMFSVLLDLKARFSSHLVTGFNCRTLNRDGSVRHHVIHEGEGFNFKKSVGGINMLYNWVDYEKWVKPALIECMEFGGNWDHKTCIRSEKDGYAIVCAVPSVVQHIGVTSSMGHSAGGEPPDVADDFYAVEKIKRAIEGPIVGEYFSMPADEMTQEEKSFKGWATHKLHLPNVTLVGVDCVDVKRLLHAIDISCEHIFFGGVKVLSSLKSDDPRVVKIRNLPTKADYSEFMMKELADYIDTKYLLIVQYDGFVLNAASWDDEWLKYDYVGAPWEWYTDGMNVGNGGFSLRSKKLMQITANDKSIVAINEAGVTNHKEEDHCICRLYRRYLESEYKMKFAPIEVARNFSIEGWNSPNKTWNGEFGFHGRTADISKSKIIF